MTAHATRAKELVTAASVAVCRVERLRLHRFRNYAETTVRFGARINVISGRNAQGKTNLLEALATLALTRSPRSPSNAHLVQWGSDQCLAEATVSRPAHNTVIALRLTRDPDSDHVSRSVTVDGKPRAARAMLGICPVVLFWPEDLTLVKGGPDARRRLLDVLLAQTDHRVSAHLVRYRRVLEQRNALLHQMRAGAGGADELASFTRELAHHGAEILIARARLVAALTPLAASALDTLSDGREQLRLTYATSHGDKVLPDGGAEAAETSLLDALQARAGEEIARGVTVIGPHRDDVDIELDGRPARSSASQGQQRSIVLALKLAEVRHIHDVSGIAPVILLDDVLSELDPPRRATLLEMLSAAVPHQIIITTTDAATTTAGGRDARHFTVSAGSVEET